MNTLNNSFRQKIIKVAYNVIEKNLNDFFMFKLWIDHWVNEKTVHKRNEYLNMGLDRSGVREQVNLVFDQHEKTISILSKRYPANIDDIEEILIDILIDVLKPRTSMAYVELTIEIKDSLATYDTFANRYFH